MAGEGDNDRLPVACDFVAGTMVVQLMEVLGGKPLNSSSKYTSLYM